MCFVNREQHLYKFIRSIFAEIDDLYEYALATMGFQRSRVADGCGKKHAQ
jgi:hypothetical protein